MAKCKISQDDEKVIAQYLYKYLDFNNLKAVQELKKIDLFGNNYLDKTIYSYLAGLRTYLKNKHKNKGVPLYIFEEGDKLRSKCYPKLTPSNKDRYIAKRSETTISAEPKTTILQTPQISETSQRISAIKSKLDLKIRELDAEIERCQKHVEKLQISKNNAKADVLDRIFEILQK